MPALRTSCRPVPLRRALVMLVACAAVVGVAPGAHAAQAPPFGLPGGESLLFVMHAESGSMVRHSGNRYTLTLRDSARQTTWFADRPARDAGRIFTRSLVRGWSQLGFSADRPNAVLSTSGKGFADVVLELGRPRMHRPGLTLKIPVRTLGRRPSSRRLSFGLASLFIDSASIGGGCGYTGQVTFFPERVTPRQGGLTPADGRLVSAASHPDLYEVVGNRFGGDSASFKLPEVQAPPGLQALICASGEEPRSRQQSSDLNADDFCEAGHIQLFAQEQALWDHLPADGRVVPIRGQAGLYFLFNTRFGGDGYTTFGVPALPAPPGMSWQICRVGFSSPPSCILSQVEYQATDFVSGPARRWLPATGRLYPISGNTGLFSLLLDAYGGDRLSTFGVPAVPDPAPGVHAGICSAGTYPDLR